MVIVWVTPPINLSQPKYYPPPPGGSFCYRTVLMFFERTKNRSGPSSLMQLLCFHYQPLNHAQKNYMSQNRDKCNVFHYEPRGKYRKHYIDNRLRKLIEHSLEISKLIYWWFSQVWVINIHWLTSLVEIYWLSSDREWPTKVILWTG